MSITKREFQPDALMQFACGFDALAGEVRSSAVMGMVPNNFSGGTQTSFSLFKIEKIEDFLESLEISASVSIQASFGKGGAKAKFSKQIKIHDYSLYIAVVVNVDKGTKILQSPVLIPAAAKLLKDDREKFRKSYGDEFLAAVTSGGEFVAVL